MKPLEWAPQFSVGRYNLSQIQRSWWITFMPTRLMSLSWEISQKIVGVCGSFSLKTCVELSKKKANMVAHYLTKAVINNAFSHSFPNVPSCIEPLIFNEIKFSRRETNQVAHCLANAAINNIFSHSFPDVPRYIERLILNGMNPIYFLKNQMGKYEMENVF